eukprot:3182903-Rhodomonas_salina.1
MGYLAVGRRLPTLVPAEYFARRRTKPVGPTDPLEGINAPCQHRYLKYIETMMYQVSYAMPSTEIAFSATRYPVVGRGVCCYANFGTHAIPSTDLGYGAMSVRY